MILFQYDRTFEGLLTAVFDAYARRSFPDRLLGEEEALPLFYDELFRVITDGEKANRVWRGLEKRLSKAALSVISIAWLSEVPEAGELLFRYIRLAIDAPRSIELNFGDPTVMAVTKLWKRVSNERLRVAQFLRFQKAADGTYFSALSPLYNVLPLVIPHLLERFADQRWLVYDLRRAYGYYYDGKEAEEVTFSERAGHLQDGLLDPSIMDKDERLFQEMWRTYFHSIAIKERLNPRLHRQNMPARFWPYMPEKA